MYESFRSYYIYILRVEAIEKIVWVHGYFHPHGCTYSVEHIMHYYLQHAARANCTPPFVAAPRNIPFSTTPLPTARSGGARRLQASRSVLQSGPPHRLPITNHQRQTGELDMRIEAAGLIVADYKVNHRLRLQRANQGSACHEIYRQALRKTV